MLGVFLVGTGAAYYLTSTATGSLAIRIHDSPPIWSSLTITFSEVAVHPADAANDSGWIPLDLSVTRIDFLAAANVSDLLAVDRVAPGTYSQLRIVVSSAQGILSGGAPVTMAVRNGAVVAGTPFTVHGGGTTTLTLDLDLGRSVQQVGGVWEFQPVLGPSGIG